MTAEMEEITIDWAAAEVREGTLRVPLQGEAGDGWRQHAERTLRLLGNEESERVSVEEGELQVEGVKPGEEERVRHLLRGLVDQANAACAAEEAAEQQDSGDSDEGPHGDDARLTEAFRGFADGDGAEQHR